MGDTLEIQGRPILGAPAPIFASYLTVVGGCILQADLVGAHSPGATLCFQDLREVKQIWGWDPALLRGPV